MKNMKLSPTPLQMLTGTSIRYYKQRSPLVVRAFATEPPQQPPTHKKIPNPNPKWLREALAKTPVLDLSERNTYSDYVHPTVTVKNYIETLFVL
jgi:hypothetical protein